MLFRSKGLNSVVVVPPLRHSLTHHQKAVLGGPPPPTTTRLPPPYRLPSQVDEEQDMEELEEVKGQSTLPVCGGGEGSVIAE